MDKAGDFLESLSISDIITKATQNAARYKQFFSLISLEIIINCDTEVSAAIFTENERPVAQREINTFDQYCYANSANDNVVYRAKGCIKLHQNLDSNQDQVQNAVSNGENPELHKGSSLGFVRYHIHGAQKAPITIKSRICTHFRAMSPDLIPVWGFVSTQLPLKYKTRPQGTSMTAGKMVSLGGKAYEVP